MRLIRIATSNQAAHIESARELLTAFARFPQLRPANSGSCNAFLGEILKAMPLYSNFGVVEANGDLRCSAVPLTARINVADRAYFRKSSTMRTFAVGDYVIGRVTQQPSITYAYPLLTPENDVEGVVFAAQSLNWLTTALANIEFPDGAVLVVVDSTGTVLARIPEAKDTIGKALPERAVLEELAARPKGSVFTLNDEQGVRRLWAHAPLIEGHDLHTLIGVPEAVAFADVDRRLARNVAGLAIVTVLALGAAWFGARWIILRQVDALAGGTRELAAGDLHARVPVLGPDSELGGLARAFNAMAETLQTRERDLRLANERTHKAEIEVAVGRAQIEIAREIQRTLLPEDPLDVAGVKLAGRCIPAAAVGGDYFGYFPRQRNGVDSFIGDVSGHGVGAAMLMASARTIFMTERLVAQSAAPILAKLNGLLFADLNHANHFMSGCCATFDATTRDLHYASAGHPPALLLRRGEHRCRALDADGVLLGVERSARFAETTVKLGRDDIVAFYTDGLTECESESGELFGLERLEQVVVAGREDDPETIVASALSALETFAGGKRCDDDVTIVVMKATE
ncbi:MAG TPA: SpoIIE family protein phosphatase [Casimicrobiaceae bacterium]|nr:SpoIIE family protein phosphatase [Casimicrobiaceae bacterium]